MKSVYSVPLCLAGCAAAETVRLSVPAAPAPGTIVLDGAYQGYSMELASFRDYAGNLSAPNKLSIRMLQNLKQITGSTPEIRIGGTTANHATFVPGQSEAIIQNYAVAGADQPANVTLGPSYIESFKTFDKGTKYTIGITFDPTSEGGEDKSVAEAQVFYDGLKDTLYAIEVGNEFDVFPVDRNKTTWNIARYASEWLERTSAISRRIPSVPKPIYQAGAFVYPGLVSPDLSWTTTAALDLGVASTGLAKTFCVHQYFGAACRPVKPTLLGSIFNRTVMHEYMRYHKVSADASAAKGLKYVIGETNSIACQGLAGLSDVFASSLWSVDYALYAASVGVTKLFWHMGTGYRYSAWHGVQNGTTAPGPRPLYYGNWLLAEALNGPNKQVVPIVNTSTLAGYAIYGASKPKQRPKLEAIALVNIDVYNATATPGAARGSVDFKLPAECATQKASVRRLSAGSVDARDGVTFGGQSASLSGEITGRKTVETVQNGVVNVKASEAVLISF